MKKEKNYLSEADVLEKIRGYEKTCGKNESSCPHRAYRNEGRHKEKNGGVVAVTYVLYKRGKNKGLYKPQPINFAS